MNKQVSDHAGWSSRLPRNWASEHVTEALCKTDLEGGNATWTLKLNSSGGAGPFYGIRPAAELRIPSGATCAISLDIEFLEAASVKSMHLVLREWTLDGKYTYQVHKTIAQDPGPHHQMLHLTVRDQGRLVHPVVQFEAAGFPSSVSFAIGKLSFLEL